MRPFRTVSPPTFLLAVLPLSALVVGWMAAPARANYECTTVEFHTPSRGFHWIYNKCGIYACAYLTFVDRHGVQTEEKRCATACGRSQVNDSYAGKYTGMVATDTFHKICIGSSPNAAAPADPGGDDYGGVSIDVHPSPTGPTQPGLALKVKKLVE